MSDLDTDLQNLGRNWRDNQRQPPRIDPSMFVESTRRTRPTLSWLVRAVAVLAVLGLGGFAIVQEHLPTRAGAESGYEAAGPSPGDDVMATGVVVVDGEGVARICDLFPVRGGNPSQEQPACSGIAVMVRGLEVRVLPGWAESGAIGFSDTVTIAGVWTGDAIEDAAVVPPPDAQPQPELPCPTPEAGWPEPPSDEFEFEAALLRLGDALAAEPARFSAYWLSSADKGSDRVAVVGVVDSLQAAQTDLESVYPYPLCVAHVDYSASDLEQAALRIGQDLGSRPMGSWRVRVSWPLNHVSVRIPIVDDAIKQLLGKYPEATVDPLVWTASGSQ
jgi:hypothetical protein